ncbi:MAG: DNA-protecting protein DprA [Actinobacteria bacterium]|nr:DNA-protecting protein DprA [Actinomycetota bacterium]
MTLSDDALATALLVSRLAADGVDPLKASEFWPLADSPGGMLGSSVDQLVALGLDHVLAERVARLLDRAVGLAFELERYSEAGIATVTVHDEGYPTRLRERLHDKAPPLLHVAGAVDLLSVAGVGIVGSRGVSEEGAEVARQVAEKAASTDLPVVSGGARGVDQLAMTAAHGVGGCVTGVLADSLMRTVSNAATRKAVLGGDTVLCTPYGPEAPFSVGTAMGRNKLIYALSTLTVVIASDEGTGGTWAGAIEALRGGFGRVAVWRGSGEGPGNAPLARRGATPLERVESIDELLAQPDQMVPAPPEPTQQALSFG